MTSRSTSASASAAAPAGERDYRYNSFTTRLMLADLRFSARAPRPGEQFPAFDLATLDAQRLRSADLVGKQPFVVILGSLTCPMTASAAEGLRELHESLGELLPFITVYTREAHPGERIPQPQKLDEKIAHARDLAMRDAYRWQVAIDDLEGTLHRRLDAKPNAVYLVDAQGRLAFRAIWSSDTAALRDAIHAVNRGELPKRATSTSLLGPMMRALPWIDQIVSRAGRSANRDLWVAAAPMALTGKIAGFRRRRAHS